MRYRPEQHLRRTAEFTAVRAVKLGRECGPFAFHLAPGKPGLRRAGFIASKRVGNAVARNRAKRRLREIFRLHQMCLPESCDLILVARKRALTDPWDVLVQRFQLTARKLGEKLAASMTETTRLEEDLAQPTEQSKVQPAIESERKEQGAPQEKGTG